MQLVRSGKITYQGKDITRINAEMRATLGIGYVPQERQIFPLLTVRENPQIGRALVVEPKLLILDEPTEGIQPNIVQEIGDIIKGLARDSGLTVLLVEQKLPIVRRIADNFAILDRGRKAAAGPIDALSDALIREYLTV
jgi:urea transport system ATP-binding protein